MSYHGNVPVAVDLITEIARQHLGARVSVRSVAGGVHSAWRVTHPDGDVFVKASARSDCRMFASEADGLQAMARGQGYAVPDVIAAGQHGDVAYLMLEWLDLGGPADSRALAAGFAGLHCVSNDRFGWGGPTWLGTVRQDNDWRVDYGQFLVNDRLLPHVDHAQGGLRRQDVDFFRDRADELVAACSAHRTASLVHGDPWGGNHGFLPDGTPAFYDPSPAWAHASFDIGFTRSFGSFDPAFYAAYQDAAGLNLDDWAIPAAIAEAIIMLAHVTMFGGGYRARVASLATRIAQLLS